MKNVLCISNRRAPLLLAGLTVLGSLLPPPVAQGLEFYVSCVNGRDVWRFNDSGMATRYLTDLAAPTGLALDKQNNLYVACSHDNTILKVTPEGERSVFATGLSVPYGMAFDAQGDLFVANNGNSSIARISPEGRVSTFATLDIHPANVAFDANGNLYTEGSSSTLLKIASDGSQTTFARGLTYPTGMAFDSAGTLYVSNGDTRNSISKITPDGVVSDFTTSPSGWQPYGLAFGSDGNLYVADVQNRIQRVSSSGEVSVVVPETVRLYTPTFLVQLVPEPASWQFAAAAALVIGCVKANRRRH